jgi:hypothetical protein
VKVDGLSLTGCTFKVDVFHSEVFIHGMKHVSQNNNVAYIIILYYIRRATCFDSTRVPLRHFL